MFRKIPIKWQTRQLNEIASYWKLTRATNVDLMTSDILPPRCAWFPVIQQQKSDNMSKLKTRLIWETQQSCGLE